MTRERLKERLAELAAEGDRESAAALRRMRIADGEIKPPPVADGGVGVRALGDFPGPTQRERINESFRQAILEKRYGARKTNNARPSLTPKSGEK